MPFSLFAPCAAARQCACAPLALTGTATARGAAPPAGQRTCAGDSAPTPRKAQALPDAGSAWSVRIVRSSMDIPDPELPQDRHVDYSRRPR